MAVIMPKVRSFICTTAHPEGCRARVESEIDFVMSQESLSYRPKKALIIGASTGYGLSSRLTLAFGCHADTLGVFFERQSHKSRTASAGWYNTFALEQAALGQGLYCGHINGDAFSEDILDKTTEVILRDLGQVDCVIYSLASPQRTDPADNITYKSVLKPIGKAADSKTLLTDKDTVITTHLEPATQKEIDATVKVMGAQDWERWIHHLHKAGALSDQALLLAYSYIGSPLTYPIYHQGTIGRAKADLVRGAEKLRLAGFNAHISIHKAVVTQASCAIPIVPLYLSILIKVLQEAQLEEDCIQQTYRLFSQKINPNGTPQLDPHQQIRLDDREMRTDIQNRTLHLFKHIDTSTLHQLSAYTTYKKKFLQLFGFAQTNINLTQDTPLPRQLSQLKNA